MQELNSTELLFVFVRNGLESTLERSTIAREHMGLLLHQLIKNGSLPTSQYYKGSEPLHFWGNRVSKLCLDFKKHLFMFVLRLQEILEVAEDMAIDIPHMWLYLAEFITPMLHEGGIPMGELFRSVCLLTLCFCIRSLDV